MNQKTQSLTAGWRAIFRQAIYEDLAAADNQDVALEDYPDRILAVLDAIAPPFANCADVEARICRISELEAEVEELQLQLAEDPWLDIDSAPRDRYLLLHDPGLKRPVIGIWNVHDSAWMDACGQSDVMPTHWMLIPKRST